MDQLLPSNRRSGSPQNSSQTVSGSSASSPRQYTPPVSSQSQEQVALENIGQTNPLCQKNDGRNPGSNLHPSKHHQQYTFIAPSQKAPNDAPASRTNSNTNGVSESRNHITCVPCHNDKPNITGNPVAKTADELLRERTKSCPRAWKAIQGMQKSMLYKPDLYRGIWAGRAKLQYNARDPMDRYATLQRILADNEMNATTTRYKQRITLLLGLDRKSVV